MSAFLETLQRECSLSDKAIGILVEEEMISDIHFQGTTEDKLKALGLKTGAAQAIVHYLKEKFPNRIPSPQSSASGSHGVAPIKMQIVTESDEDKFRKLIDKFNNGDKTAADNFGVTNVVKESNGKINPDETIRMLNYKGTLEGIWVGLDGISRVIIDVKILNEDWIYLYFRTGKHLLNGVDVNTGINWQNLGDVKLNLLVFAFQQGIFNNKDDHRIYKEFDSETGSYSAARMQYDGKGWKDDKFISSVKISTSALQDQKKDDRKPLEGTESKLRNIGGLADDRNKMLYELILSMFNVSEMNLFFSHLPQCGDMKNAVNFSDSSSNVSFNIVNYLTRNNLINTILFDNLVKSYPRRYPDILKVALAFGFAERD